MDNGTIIAKGDHLTLLKECEVYREIYDQQTKGGKENE